MNNKLKSLYAFCILAALSLSSCRAIAGIFKAGMWVGIVIVVIILAVIFWLVSKARKS